MKEKKKKISKDKLRDFSLFALSLLIVIHLLDLAMDTDEADARSDIKRREDNQEVCEEIPTAPRYVLDGEKDKHRPQNEISDSHIQW